VFTVTPGFTVTSGIVLFVMARHLGCTGCLLATDVPIRHQYRRSPPPLETHQFPPCFRIVAHGYLNGLSGHGQARFYYDDSGSPNGSRYVRPASETRARRRRPPRAYRPLGYRPREKQPGCCSSSVGRALLVTSRSRAAKAGPFVPGWGPAVAAYPLRVRWRRHRPGSGRGGGPGRCACSRVREWALVLVLAAAAGTVTGSAV